MKKGLNTLVGLIVGTVVGSITTGKKMNKVVKDKQESEEKFRMMYQMLDKWMQIKQRNENLTSYFKAYGYSKIAIYGMSDMGRFLLNDMKDTEINVEYGIDRNTNISENEITIYSPDDKLPEIDAIVVTAIAYYNEIEELLEKKVNCPIISLEDIVYEVV